MKKFSLLLAAVLISSVTFAGSKIILPKTLSGMSVVKSNATSYKLIYKSEETSDVKIQIFNDENSLVFSEIVHQSDGFMRPYNFANLNAGEYTIKIDNGSNWLTQTIDYKPAASERLVHLVALKDDRVLLTVPGQGEDRLRVRIIDENGEVVYNNVNPVDGNFAQLFDLSNGVGACTFEITDESGATTTVKR